MPSLQGSLGYDPDRIWRVEAIQTTQAAGVSKVVVFVTDRKPNAKVASAAFFVLPDGKHAIADASGVIPFGTTPFAEARKTLQDRADGAYRGSASKDLMLVEFADLQCPHCKRRAGNDGPPGSGLSQRARRLPELLLIVDIHPFAFKAAAYGYCIAKQKNEAFLPYASDVFSKQEALTALQPVIRLSRTPLP